jgi:hypothetical protein
MQGLSVSLAIDGNGFNAHFTSRTHYPQRNFAAIGDQYFIDFFHAGFVIYTNIVIAKLKGYSETTAIYRVDKDCF